MKNPFKYGEIVAEESFCNRETEQRELKEHMESGQNVLVLSERRMGKTSLLRVIMDEMTEADYSCAYIDLLPTENRVDFAERLAKSFAETLQSPVENILKTVKDWFSGFRFTPEYDTATDSISFSVNFQGNENKLELDKVLAVPEKISERRETGVIVVFDEIQQIKQYPDDFVERKLRSVIQHHPDVTYIFLGSRRHVVEDMFLEQSSPFYRSSKTYPLEPIAGDDWIPFLQKHFQAGERKVTVEFLEDICELTEGHPYYTQHLCSVIWGLTEPGDILDDELLQAAMERILSEEDYTYTSIIESLTTNQRKLLIALAEEEKESPKIYSENFRNKHRLGNSSTVDTAKKALLKRGLLDVEEKNVFIVDRFFKRWICRRY